MNPKNEISMIDSKIAVEIGWANYWGHFNDSENSASHLRMAQRYMVKKENLILEVEKQERSDAINEEYKRTSRF